MVQIHELQAKKGFDIVSGTITKLWDGKIGNDKNGKPYQVRNGMMTDEAGSEVKFAVWNELNSRDDLV